MKICFPVQENNGFESKVYNHFGSAPMFVVYDPETNEVSALDNGDLNHQHGACNPAKALGGKEISAVVTGGIGQGAIMGLMTQGIAVFRAEALTVIDNLKLLKEDKLQLLSKSVCDHGHHHGADHSDGGSCCH